MNEKDLLTGMSRLLVFLHRKGGRASYTEARKILGSNISNALLRALNNDLVDYDQNTRIIQLKGKGKTLAKCLALCLESER